MTSEIKVDTISEQTSANGVTIDGLTIKDGNIIGDVALAGTTPTFTIGDAGAEDAALIFDGNAQDFYIALDDSADDLLIGKGSTVGTTPAISIDENIAVTTHGDFTLTGASTGAVWDSSNNSLDFADSTQLRFGASADLKVYHDGTHSYIVDSGTGNLKIQSSALQIMNAAGSENILLGTQDGAVTIYNNNIAMYNTSATENVFNEVSNDIDFRVESNGNTHMLFVDGGNNRVGVAVSAPESTLHIEGIITQNEGNVRNTISSTSTGLEFTGNSGSANVVRNFVFKNATSGGSVSEKMRILGGGQISTGGETSPDVGTGGLGLNQGANDDPILTFKSSDMAHGHTNTADADTFFTAIKKSATNGGIKMSGFTDTGGGHAFEITGIQEEANSAEATSASSAVCVNAFRREGGTANTQALPASHNVFGIKNADDMQCLFKGDGEIHTNTAGTSNAGSVSTYDEYDDAQLVRAFDLSKGHYARGLIDSQFDKFVKYNIQDLVDANIIGTDDDGNATSFVNITGLQRLHNGAIWQQYEKTQRLTNAMYELAKAAVGEEKANEILEQNEIKLLN